MMIFTHVLMGAFVGVGVASLYPAYFHVAVVAGFIGGGISDADMLFTHRRTLHFPLLASVVSIAVGGIVFVWPTAITIGVFCFTTSGAVHSLTDILGGGKEMRPWLETDDRAVYNHVTQRWIRPRRVFYDGSIADLGLSVVLAVVLLVVLPTGYKIVVGITLACGVVYTVLRRWITRRISDEYGTFSEYIQYKLRTVLD